MDTDIQIYDMSITFGHNLFQYILLSSSIVHSTIIHCMAKLPELAGLFGVSIDELLGEKSELVESLTKDGGKIYLEANPITPKELSEVAPILKPDQVDEVFEKLEVSDLKEIENLLPFIGGSVVDNILLKAAESGDGRDLDIVAPFAGKDALGKAAVKLYQRFGMRGIEELIPFLSGEQREDIAELEYARNGLRMAGVEDEIFDLLDGFTDFERLGRSMMEEDGVQATSFGSIKRLSAPFPQQPEMGQTMY